MVPVQILDDIIKSSMAVLKDPREGSSALMYYSQLWKNSKLYNIEILYEKNTNTVMHFKYSPDPMGPLKEIR